MKKNSLLLIAFVVFIAFSSCHHHGRIRTVEVHSNEFSLKIQYRGQIVFNENGTEVKSISPFGFVRYRRNDDRLVITSDEDGTLHYKIFDDGNQLSINEEKARMFVSSVMPEIADHYDR